MTRIFAVRTSVPPLLALLVLLFFSQASSYAQRGRPSPQDRAQRLKEYLSLTDEQSARVEAIYLNAQKEISANTDQRGDRDAQRQKVRNIMGKTEVEIDQLLTEPQKAKFAEWKKKHGGTQPRFDRRKNDSGRP